MSIHPIDLATPRCVSDATRITANPAAYRDRPTLLHLARLILMSRAGATPRQTGPRAGKPALVQRADRRV